MENKDPLYLFTNGHGEDEIGLSIIEHLENLDIRVFPFVGNGEVFRKKGIEVLYKGKIFSSGGLLVREGLRSVLGDLKEGFLFEFFKILHRLILLSDKKFTSLIVGDLFPVLLLYIFTKKKSFLVLSSKSSRIKPFTPIEFFVLRNMCIKVFVRDPETKKELLKAGIEAIYLGNPIKEVEKKKIELKSIFKKKKIGILFLPGSRMDLYKNISYMLEIIDGIVRLGREKSFSFIFHLPQSFSWKLFSNSLSKEWNLIKQKNFYSLVKVYEGNRKVEVLILKNMFFETLRYSRIVIGLSGTANERSVGTGKPVLAFPVPNSHATSERFTKRQIPLLGENLIYFPIFNSLEIAKKVVELSFDKKYLSYLKVKGRETVGKSGIIPIAEFLSKFYGEPYE